jgi:hypothetical protein
MIPSACCWKLVACFLLAVALVACTRRSDAPFPATAGEIDVLKGRLVPADAVLLRSSEPVRTTSGVRASWEIQTKSDAQSYFQWLKSELGPAYHTTLQTGSTLSLARDVEGDSYIITVTNHGGVGGARVEVNLVALSD